MKTDRILGALAIVFLAMVVILALRPTKPVPLQTDDADKARSAQMLEQLAAGLTTTLKRSGSDVVVYGFDNALIFDCSRELDPRRACYQLYKTFPANAEDEAVLRSIAVHNVRFKTDDSIMSGFAWSKSIQ